MDSIFAFPITNAWFNHDDRWQPLFVPDGFVPLPFPPPTADEAAPAADAGPWTMLQDELLGALDAQPPESLAFSLLLPRLGAVDVMMTAQPPQGWDIALRFAPATFERFRPRREYCRRSLSDALGCRIRLRFDVREEER